MSVECDYCQGPTRLINGRELYEGRRKDLWERLFYYCAPCKAWVGTHRGAEPPRALGRLANKELRAAKQRAHAAFDPLWQRRMTRDGLSRKVARGVGYAWLAVELDIDREACHIGMFDVEMCARVVAICEPHHRKVPA